MVVVPSLTPGSYNHCAQTRLQPDVVVPSLTPGSYNQQAILSAHWQVVVPSLTPGSYNRPRCKPCTTGLTALFTRKKMDFFSENWAIFFIFFKKCLEMAVACQ